MSGIFMVGKDVRVTLVDEDSGASSSWLRVGGSFAGYKLVEFDEKTKTLLLKREGSEYRIGLRSEKIENQRVAMEGKIQFGPNKELDVTRVTLIYGNTVTIPVTPSVNLTIKPNERKDGNISYEIEWESVDDIGEGQTLAAMRVIAEPGSSFSSMVGDYGFTLGPIGKNFEPSALVNGLKPLD